jgi:hypothetical protein
MTVENTTLSTKVGLLISYYITMSFWSAQTLTLSMVSRNIAGQTKKATVVAATFVSWAAGNAIGKLPFPSKVPCFGLSFVAYLFFAHIRVPQVTDGLNYINDTQALKYSLTLMPRGTTSPGVSTSPATPAWSPLSSTSGSISSARTPRRISSWLSLDSVLLILT